METAVVAASAAVAAVVTEAAILHFKFVADANDLSRVDGSIVGLNFALVASVAQ